MSRKLSLPDSPALGAQAGKLDAPSARRNLEPLLAALAGRLPEEGRALELASGTGQHVVAFARAHPGLHWTPSDVEMARLASIAAWAEEAGLPNLAGPVRLDACAEGWAARRGPVDVLVLVNLLHLISDAEMAVLLDEAEQALAPGGVFALYGPFLRGGVATSAGDAAFDASLRAQDPAIGYKDAQDVADVAGALGLAVERVEMPANNLLFLLRKPVRAGV